MEEQLLERATELEQRRLRVGAGLGQGRRFPPRAQPDAPASPTQDTEHSHDLESALIRLEEEQQRWDTVGIAGRAVLSGHAPTGPFSPTQKRQPGPGERYAPRAAGPGELGQPGSE